MANIIVFKSAACTDLACFHQLLCTIILSVSSVYLWDPNSKRFKRRLIYFNTDTQYANFAGNPLYRATKRHLNNKGLKPTKKNEKDSFWLRFCSLFGAWKIVGIYEFLKEFSVPANTMLGGSCLLRFYCSCCFRVTASIPAPSTFRLFFFVFAPFLPLVSPWYNRTGWLGVKHQFTYLLTSLSCLFVCLWFCLRLLCSALWSSVWVSSSVIVVVFCHLNCIIPSSTFHKCFSF